MKYIMLGVLKGLILLSYYFAHIPPDANVDGHSNYDFKKVMISFSLNSQNYKLRSSSLVLKYLSSTLETSKRATMLDSLRGIF